MKKIENQLEINLNKYLDNYIYIMSYLNEYYQILKWRVKLFEIKILPKISQVDFLCIILEFSFQFYLLSFDSSILVS